MPTIIEPYVSRVAPQQPSAPNIQLDDSVGRALQNVGQALTSVGARAAQQKKQRDAQAAQLGLMGLNEAANQKLIELDRDAPANGADLAKTYNDKFLMPETEKFLGGLPDDLKGEYTQRVEIFRQQHLNNASNQEYKRGNEFSQSVIGQQSDTSKQGIATNPVAMNDFIEDFNAAVDAQPNLTTAQREKYKAEFAQAAPAMVAETLKTQDPQTLVAMLGGMTPEQKADYLMDPLADGVYFAETSSGANVKVSKAGARGAMQVMPATAREMAAKLGDTDFLQAPESEQKRLLDTDYYSMRYGRAYLKEQLGKYDGDLELALIAYNAGGKRVEEFLANGRHWNDKLGKWADETGPYVAKVIEHMGTKALAGKPTVEASDGTKLTGNRLPIRFADAPGRQPVNPDGLDPGVVEKWEATQGTFGRQLNVVSAHRDGKTNALAGGAKQSRHLTGAAIDIDVSGLGKQERIRLIKIASAAGFTGVGVYNNSLHLDTGNRRAWGPTHNKDSVPEWAQGVIKDHMAGGLGGADVAQGAPATSTGNAGSGAGEVLRGVAPPPSPKFSGKIAADFAGLSGATLISLRSEAITAAKTKTEEQKKAEADLKTSLVATAGEDAASILVSGKSIIEPEKMQDFETNLLRSGGLDEVNKWRSARYVNGSVYEATKNLGKMSSTQITELVEAVKPTGGENAVQEIEVEKGVIDKVTKELEKRTTDPAAYVQTAPEVRDAASRVNKNDITSVERYFEAVRAEQELIGVPFTPLSAEEAKKAAGFISKTFIDAELNGVDTGEASKQILAQFEKNYGGFADDVYVQALSQSLDNRISNDTKQLLSQTFVEWIKANPSVSYPKNTIRERINYFKEIGAIEQATAPLSDEAPPTSWLEYLGISATGPQIGAGAIAKDAMNLWETIGKPAAKAIGDAMPPPPPEPPEVPYTPTPEQPPGAGTAPRMPFTMPGVDDNDLNALGNNANDPAVQDRFRNSYGGDRLNEAMKLLKERMAP